MKLRKAKVTDAPQIQKIINQYAEKKIMLMRSLNEVYDKIQCFYVIEHIGKVTGCCAMNIVWEELAEIKSLAVVPKFCKKGLGTKLIQQCHKEAKKLGVKRVFALTYIPKFFKKFGYKETSREELPHKIWAECIKCPFFPDCNEIAVIKVL